MTTPAHAQPAMTLPPDQPQPHPADQAAIRPAGAVRSAVAGLNVVTGVLSAALVALMVFAFTTLDNRITSLDSRLSSLESRVNVVEIGQARLEVKVDTIDTKIDELDAKFDARFEEVDAKFDELDAKFDELDAKFDEINLNLVALIAALDKTEEVDAALTGVSG